MSRQRNPKFTRKEGVLGIPREMIRSPAYRALSLSARCLLIELQDIWSPDRKAIHYSLRRAVAALNVSMGTASKTFKELRSGGFIDVVAESNLIERKAREYRLTWMPNDGKEPTDEWRLNGQKLESAFSLGSREDPICYPSVADEQSGENRPTKNQGLTGEKPPRPATQAEHH